MTLPLFCTQCLKAGHRCPAIAIEREAGDPVLCAFCEDGVACPVKRREADLAFRARPVRPMLGEPKRKPPLAPRTSPSRTRPATVSVHAGHPPEFIHSTAARELIAAAQKESTTMAIETTELCPCGKPLRHRGRCLGGGYPKPGDGRRTRKAGKPGRKPAHVALPAAHPGAATLCLSERQLVKLFTGWPLGDKVACVQAWLDRADVAGAL